MVYREIEAEKSLAAGLALPHGQGSYALLLHLAQSQPIEIGRLGSWSLAAGYYLYLGSACGPGGLAARLRRHLSPEKRPFWHIDYLRQAAEVVAIGYLVDPTRWEHRWAAAAAGLPMASILVPRFGASDCRCPTHLLYFPERPTAASLISLLPEAASS
jgi:Uri superfamily endonuclease